MRKAVQLLSLFMLVVFLSSCSGKKEHIGKFSYEPDKPAAGENITIYFNADSTKLAKDSSVKMFAYFFNDKPDTTVEKTMEKEENIWTAKVKAPSKCSGVIIKFTDGDEKEEDNGQKGYVILFADKTGKIPAEAEADLAVAYTGWGRVGGMARDYKKALDAFDSAFNANPELKNKYLDQYFEAMWKKDKNAAKELIKNELEKLRLKKNKTDNDYLILWTWYGNLGENVKSGKYKEEAIKLNPKGKVAEQSLISKFRMERDFIKKKQLLNRLKNNFPTDKSVNDLFNNAAYYATKTGKKKIIFDFFTRNKSLIHPYYFAFAGDEFLKKGDLNSAEHLYDLGAEHVKELLADLTKTLPEDMSLNEYEAQIKYYLGKNQYGLAKIYLKKNDNKKALSILKEAVVNTINYNVLPELLESYIHVLVNAGLNDEALKKGERFIKEGNSTEGMLKDLKKAYIASKGSDKGFETYLSKNQNSAKEMMIRKIKGELVNEHAPDFTLKDVNGKSVTLSSLKGKIVVLDFWATWCGPCLRSFPAMNKLANEYKNSEDVVFLFINTWENVKDKVQNVKDFAKKNNYKLEFLIDADNKAVTAYKVTGIPTKVFIGRDGNIRMRSVGFAGNTDQLVTEVKAIINILKELK